MSTPSDIPFGEWDFSDLARFETGPAWFYESLREFVVRMPSQQARSYQAEVEQLRELVRGKSGREKRIFVMERHKPLPTIFPVEFEAEWPGTPYLAIDAGQRKRRLMELVPEFLPDSPEFLVADLLIAREPEEVNSTLLEKMSRGEYPFVPSEHLHNWIEYFLGQHGLESGYRLDTIDLRYSVKILPDPSIGLAAFLRRAKALYLMLGGQKEPTKKPGRRPGNLYAKNRPDLRALGAYRLVKVLGLTVQEAIDLMIERLGKKAYYTDPRSFQRAVDYMQNKLRRFLQSPDLNAE